MGAVSDAVVWRPPEKLTAEHDLSEFDCGEPELNDWLRRHALTKQQSSASRTYAILNTVGRVVGYYSLAAGSVARDIAPGRVKRNMPEPVPVVVLGRLAIDRAFQRQGLGRALLRDAVLRTIQAADEIGVRAILVHAISEPAKQFYQKCGFVPSPINTMTLMVNVAVAVKLLVKQ